MARKKHDGGHSGGSWKVAYADFVTAMMALFLCLWLTSQDQKIKDAVERAFRNPFSSITKESTGIIPNKDASSTYRQEGKFTSVSAIEIESMHHLHEDLEKLFKDQSPGQNSIKIDVNNDGLSINVFDRSAKPIFVTGSDQFTEYGAWVFTTLAWEIARYSTFRLELEGHTETETNGLAEDVRKWELSTERANSARRKIVIGGVGTEQISKVSGFADTQPMPDTSPDDESNRRVTVLIKIRETVNALPDALKSDIPNDASAN
ncbi:MAG TPA: flagellar motor protein MotB [Candidatus Sulfotelmatobacter sp.]|jgi:chemotaxis protein MotB|nr:flagellar motor protein MotB [Candidatus Sulfotelmatobacter sp.]